jgi:hypothetical protein
VGPQWQRYTFTTTFRSAYTKLRVFAREQKSEHLWLDGAMVEERPKRRPSTRRRFRLKWRVFANPGHVVVDGHTPTCSLTPRPLPRGAQIEDVGR